MKKYKGYTYKAEKTEGKIFHYAEKGKKVIIIPSKIHGNNDSITEDEFQHFIDVWVGTFERIRK